ncbi:sensor histidine kinase [Pseudomonas syringae pv. actinidiae]|nr:sensor histidine kinase [Pseudomonas syringae pv. actinidiae]
MGHGIPLSIHDAHGLDKTLEHVVSEIQRVHPARLIRSNIGALELIRCDHERIAQLLSNLVSNAITHGAFDSSVEVAAGVLGDRFVLSVANQGEPIPESMRSQLFLPYSRPITNEPQAGLGLGLYIASEIAQAHGGTLDVSSTQEGGTVFTFSMPLRPSGACPQVNGV